MRHLVKNPNKQNKKPDACKEHELSIRLPFYNRMATPERKKADAAIKYLFSCLHYSTDAI